MKNNFGRSFKQKLKKTLRSPIAKPLRDFYKGTGVCLTYHSIIPTAHEERAFEPNKSISVTKELFEKQIRHISEEYDCIDLSTAMSLFQQNRLSAKNVIVTFDDGYLDNMTIALPILEKYNVPATIFVCTGMINGVCSLWWEELEFILRQVNSISLEWRKQYDFWYLMTGLEKNKAFIDLHGRLCLLPPTQQAELLAGLYQKVPGRYSYEGKFLTWEQVKQLDEHPLITIGAHTVNHSVLSSLSMDVLRKELLESKQELEERLNHPVEHLAYPFGDKGQAGVREFQMAKELGYVSAFTTRYGHIHRAHTRHMHGMPRLHIDYEDSFEDFTWKLSGMASMIHHRGKRVIVH